MEYPVDIHRLFLNSLQNYKNHVGFLPHLSEYLA